MKWIFYCCIICISTTTSAQDSFPHQKVFGLNTYYGKIFIHTKTIKNVEGSKPYGLEIEYSKQQIDPATYEFCSCYPKAGFSLTYWNFDNDILGHGLAVSRILAPAYRITNKLQFKLRGAFGRIYLTDPYDKIKNTNNHSYSLKNKPQLPLRGGFITPLSDHWSAALLGSFHHTSNGSFKEPNRGINWTTTAVSVQYAPGSNVLPAFKRTYDKSWQKKPLIIETGFMFTPAQQYNTRLQLQRKYQAGVFIQTTKHIGRTSGVTAGTEIYYNRIDSTAKNITSPVVAGVHAGHMFLNG